MIKEKQLLVIRYARVEKLVGDKTNGIVYMDNIFTYDDGTKRIRKGITNIYGDTIKDKYKSLQRAIKPNNKDWWSLQVTNEIELKAAYRFGFRNKLLENAPLKDYIERYENNGQTIHLEYKGK